MPSLGADMEEGTLVEWLVGVGDRVERGDIVASVETDKSTIEVEVFESGTVEELLVEPGTSVAVGAALARIGDGPGGTSSPPTVDHPPTAAPVEAPGPDRPGTVVGDGPGRRHASVLRSPLVRHLAERLDVDTSRLQGTGPGGVITRHDVQRSARPFADAATTSSPRATPRARRRAAELGVDLRELTGTGVAGAICERDVTDAARRHDETADSRAAPVGEEPGVDRMRAAIARTMERSNREIPHYHLSSTIDLGALTDWLATRNTGRPASGRVLPAAAILRACALAAVKVPELNGEWRDGAPVTADQVHLGVLVSLRRGGLMAPVIRDAQDRSVEELMATLSDLVERARRGSLRSSELSGATLTVTNLGDRGVDEVHGVIHPPQLAIVGVGRIALRPLVVDGEVVARPSAVVTLGADHRATDGRTGSRFLRHLETVLADPTRLEPAEEST